MKKTILMAALLLCGVFLAYSQGFGLGDIPGAGGGPGSNQALNKARLRMDDAQDKMNGKIAMRFFNALDGKPIVGAFVEIPNVGTLTTNNEGKITFNKIKDGTYPLIFSKEGFITSTIDFRVLLGAVDLNWYSISPGFSNRDYRIVLDWAEKPADLDIHFVKTGGTGAYHIAYSDMRNAEDGNAILDRDSRDGNGPETITIGKIDLKATYTCYVQDYTNRNNTASAQMATQGAVIRVYSQNKLMHTIRIPDKAPGVKWNVFKIEKGILTPVNTVSAR